MTFHTAIVVRLTLAPTYPWDRVFWTVTSTCPYPGLIGFYGSGFDLKSEFASTFITWGWLWV